MVLVAVTNGKLEEGRLGVVIKEIAPYVHWIILRENQKTPQAYLSFVKHLLESGVHKQKLCIHDRVDIACLSGINKVHLPEKGLPVRDVKASFPFLKIGVSVHSVEAARQAEEQGADYAMFGHIYQTASKEGIEPRGLEELEKITGQLHIPVIAIGGITPERVSCLYEKGASGAAVMSGIFNEDDPLKAVRTYKKEELLYEQTL